MSSSTYHLGCGPVEPLGNATGCLLANSVGDKFIAVRIYNFNFLTFSDPTKQEIYIDYTFLGET